MLGGVAALLLLLLLLELFSDGGVNLASVGSDLITPRLL
jgi:hypothetical protein